MSCAREFTPAATYWTPGSARSALASSGVSVVDVAAALPHAALGEVAGVDGDHVGAGRLDLLLDRASARPVPSADHRDHGADADDHARASSASVRILLRLSAFSAIRNVIMIDMSFS